MIKSISYTKIVLSVGMIVFVAAMVVAGTGAFFNDTETSTGNSFTAGALDLTVDSVGHINGLVCFDGAWHPESVVEWNADDEALQLVDQADVDGAIATYNEDFPSNVPQAGDPCASTWALTDLGPETFFEFGDLKPGDQGENTISLHVENNDAYACVIIDNMIDADNDCTEPEADADGEACTVDVPEGDTGGELSQELRFFAWDDDGNNIWEDGEEVLFSNTEGPASDVIDGVVYPLYTPLTGPLEGAQTHYVGLYWCYGAITVDEVENTLECDGAPVTNLSQTDSLMADFSFYVEQARNNEGFECPALDEIVKDVPDPVWTDEGTRTGGLVEFVEDNDRGTVMQLTTIDDNDSRVRWSNFTLDVDLDTLTGISFDSQQVSAPNPAVGNATMRLFVDLDGDTNTADVQEITYEPYYNIAAHNPDGPASIVTGIWQTWPTSLANGKFWANGGFLGSTPSGGAYATNFTLQQVLDAYANAKIVGISLGMGTYNPDQVILVDDLLVNGSPMSLEN